MMQLQSTMVPSFPPFVGRVMNETLGWLNTATVEETMYFYDHLGNYPIAKPAANYSLLRTVLYNRAIELGLNIVTKRDNGIGLVTTLFIEPEQQDYEPEDESPVISPAFTAAEELAQRISSAYQDEPLDAPIFEIEDGKVIYLHDLLNLCYVFLRITTTPVDVVAGECL